MRFPIAIEAVNSKHAYGVVVRDLPGCFSAGDALDEASTDASDAILVHLEGLLDGGRSFPKPSTIEQLCSKRSRRGWTRAMRDVDLSELGDKAARVNIALPRSGFLARAALDAIRKPARAATEAAVADRRDIAVLLRDVRGLR